jgi:hypothetical protein
LFNHKTVFGTRNPAFLVGAVMGSGFLLSKVCRVKFELLPVRWLGSSFAFFCLAFALEKNANVLPNALALVEPYLQI